MHPDMLALAAVDVAAEIMLGLRHHGSDGEEEHGVLVEQHSVRDKPA
jgi:hypothetical protein